MKQLHLLLAITLCSFLSLKSQIVYVVQGGSGSGASWNNATGNLKEALDNAEFGDEVWVASGTFYPLTCQNCMVDQRGTPFQVKDGVKLYGGFAGWESAISQRNIIENPSYLSGDIDQDGSSSNNSYTVLFTENVGDNTLIDGFIITGGRADNNFAPLGEPFNSGAGWYNKGSLSGGASHPVIQNCTFNDNWAWGFGGGTYNNASFGGSANPILSNCSFSDNTANMGAGGFYNTAAFDGDCNPQFNDCLFENNQAPNGTGGAIIHQGAEGGVCSPGFYNCTFTGNFAGVSGGGIQNFSMFGESSPTFYTCTFEQNSSNIAGALYNDGAFEGNSSPILDACVFKDNQSTQGDGGAIYNSAIENGHSNPQFIRCTISNNESSAAGGAIFNNGIGGECVPEFIHCRINDNLANTYGGAVYNQGKAGNASPVFTNCLVYNNAAISSAGAIYNLGAENGNSSPMITNCTFFGNSAVIGGTIYNNASPPNGNSSPVIKNCVFWNNNADFGSIFRNINGTPNISYCLVDAINCDDLNSGIDGTVNCNGGMLFNENPQFINAENGDFHLSAASPAIDMGENSIVNNLNLTLDLDSLPRIHNDFVDFGVYEYGAFFDFQPFILENPMGQEICEGEMVTLSVSATAPVALFYQWQKNDIDIPGAMEPELTISNSSLGDSGNYHCVVSNDFGDVVNSSVASIIVNAKLEVSLLIEATAEEICEGEAVTFTAIPTNGGSNPIFQWAINGNNIGTSVPAFTSNNINSGDQISCTISTNETCVLNNVAASNVITIVVGEAFDVSLSIQANSNIICDGGDIIFVASPTNQGMNPIFEWFINGNSVGNNSSVFITNNITNQDVVSCFLISSKDCVVDPEAWSNSVATTVNPIIDAVISIDADQTEICNGESITFSTTVENEGTMPEYIWMTNGTQNGGNQSTFTSNSINDQDEITCVLISSESCLNINPLESESITIIVNPILEANIDIEISTDSIICIGDTITFLAFPEFAGSDPIFNWTHNGNIVGDNSSFWVTNQLAEGDEILCTMISSEMCAEPVPATSNLIVVEVEDCMPDFTTFAESGVELELFPNPAESDFYISWKGNEAQVKLDLLSLSGKLLITEKRYFENNSTQKIGSLSNFPAGLYFLKIYNNENVETIKLIKQ